MDWDLVMRLSNGCKNGEMITGQGFPQKIFQATVQGQILGNLLGQVKTWLMLLIVGQERMERATKMIPEQDGTNSRQLIHPIWVEREEAQIVGQVHLEVGLVADQNLVQTE
jgi:hypothetical protein